MAEKKKILIVEDEPALVKALKIHLQDSGYDVITAFDAVQGISQVHKQKPDLIILDIGMPAGGGFIVAQKLKHSANAWLKSIPIIFVTGSPDERHEKMAIRLGARFYFRKPTSHEEFLDAVRSLLESKP
jgi:two-component system alkaline phosphatase synthesis response regulator PhoP